MGLMELSLIGISLAMDAFAVSICKGLTIKKSIIKKGIIIGIYFGIFQGLMPLTGYTLGNTFEKLITGIDHWIVLIFLSVIGFNMIKDSLKKEKENYDDKIDLKTMIPFAIATSIDALAVGITFSFLKVNIISTVLLIGIITFIICFIGVIIGSKFGNKYEKKSQIVGGIILILIGIKILLEHLQIIK